MSLTAVLLNLFIAALSAYLGRRGLKDVWPASPSPEDKEAETLADAARQLARERLGRELRRRLLTLLEEK